MKMMNGKTKDDLTPPEKIERADRGELLSMYNVISGFRDANGECYIGISFYIDELYENRTIGQDGARKIVKLSGLEALYVADEIERMEEGDTYYTNNRLFERIPESQTGDANASVFYHYSNSQGLGSFYVHSEQIRRVANLPIPGEENE